MSRIRFGFLVGALSAVLIALGLSCTHQRYMPAPPEWKETEVDVFPGMDGVTLDPSKPDQKEALRGRIVWNLWVGDSWKMWDYLAQHGFGTADLLKTVDSRRRPTRFQEIGIINQPGFLQATKPDPYGLFLDVPNPNDPAGHIDEKVDYETYGRSSGVIGLRVRDNPNFQGAAKTEWMKHVGPDGVNHDFYENPAYYNSPSLVRPYVVGMSCALCHVSFDPVRPPANVNDPKWENLNDYVGAQYFSVVEFFVPRRVTGGYNGQPVSVAPREEDSFVWQLINSSPRGSLDTSFIATDYLNNPGTMNGVFSVPRRLDRAAKMVSTASTGPMVEQLAGGALDLKWLKVDNGGLVPRVLKQGDDSVGFEGALSRVYVNIGHAWPEWQKHFRPLIGGPMLRNGLASQSPVTVKGLQENSASWNWSEDRSHALAVYFINYAKPLLLKDAPGGAKYINEALVPRGKEVFAENCAACHSSKQPPNDPFDGQGRITDAAKSWFREAVKQPDFFTDNFLSDERRHPVTQIGTNATRAAATNATRGHIWDNFSSETYKQLPKIPPFEVDNPYAPNGKSEINIPLPGEEKGPGYYRPPSLISLWSSAPYLHNNAVGTDPLTLTPNDVSVDARMKAFQDGIEKMLWMTPAPRGNLIWKTSQTSFINVPRAYLPDFLRDIADRHPELIDTQRDALRLGPIPAGTPINLIANANLDPGLSLAAKRVELLTGIIDTLARAKREKLSDEQVKELMRTELVPKFLALNKCPDFYEDKGHPFGRSLSMDDKTALVELLKTF
jgi:mono/diheme cytochrome c family protein